MNTIVTATFSKAMNPATLNANTFTVSGPGSTAVVGQVTYNAASHTAIFTPSANLAASTLYTAALSTGAADAFGNALASSVVWTFTTGATTCSGVGAPSVTSQNPVRGSVGGCPNTIVTATFSEGMYPPSIDSTTFTSDRPGQCGSGRWRHL